MLVLAESFTNRTVDPLFAHSDLVARVRYSAVFAWL